MTYRSASAILLTVASLAQGPSVVSDPVADFIALDLHYSNRTGSIKEISVVKADIGRSAEPEIFITHQDMYIDRSGFFWEVYTPVRGGYERVQKPITNSSGAIVGSKSGIRFRRDAFHVGTVDGVDGTSLFSYWPSGSGRGGLMGIWLEDGLVVRRKVRDMLVGHGGPDSDLYRSLFVDGMGEIVKAKVVDLATEEQRMALIGGSVAHSEPGGFVSRPPGHAATDPEGSTVASQETAPAADAPSVQASPDDEAQQPTAAGPAQSDEPENPGRSRGIVPISIGAIVCLLALAGYRVFSRKHRSAP